jgi:hypothetical protein
LLKHLHKFYNRVNTPWVQLVWDRYYPDGKLPKLTSRFKGSYWWRDILKLLDSYKGIAMANVSDGVSCFFWRDLWTNNVLQQTYPELFSYCKDPFASVQKVKAESMPVTLFHLPLSTEAYVQFQHMQNMLQSVNLNQTPDQWLYQWGSNLFSSSKAYRLLIGNIPVHQVYKWLWKSSCQNKRKFFFWLLLKDRLSTRELLK